MLFRSFVSGGFECADHINRSGERVNLLRETGHEARPFEDYRLLTALGIRTVREGVVWSAVETAPYVFDFTEVGQRLRAAEITGVQVLWDLCHFGYPNGLIPTHPQFVPRFEALCAAFVEWHRGSTAERLFVCPINEISFLAWHSGDVRGTVPFATNSGWDIKWHLCRAAIAGIRVLRERDPECRIMTIEPLIRVHAGAHSTPARVAQLNNDQFQAADMIAGRMCPELGGRDDYLDVMGFNCYWDGQWVDGIGPLAWPPAEELPFEGVSPRAPDRVALGELLQRAYERYRRPFFLSETGHFGHNRPRWLRMIAEECGRLRRSNPAFAGVCLYPVIDRPDWDNLSHYHNSGLWDYDGAGNRVPHVGSIAAVREMLGVL